MLLVQLINGTAKLLDITHDGLACLFLFRLIISLRPGILFNSSLMSSGIITKSISCSLHLLLLSLLNIGIVFGIVCLEAHGFGNLFV